jgi:hypothetical protein
MAAWEDAQPTEKAAPFKRPGFFKTTQALL